MNNLQIFRETSSKFLNQGIINNVQEFKQLIRHLCDCKLLHPRQQKQFLMSLQKQIRQFPLSLQQFQKIIMSEFGDHNCAKLLDDLKKVQNQMRITKGVLTIWNDKGLTNMEIKELETTFAKGNQKISELCVNLKQQKIDLQQISEQQIQLIDSLEEWVEMQHITKVYKNYKQYLQLNNKAIDALFAKLKVRQVHFRKKINSSHTTAKIMTAVGFDSRNDQPLEVTLIPKSLNNFEKVDLQLTTFNANYELMLSKCFPKVLGFNTQADKIYYQYFREHFENSKNLEEIILSNKLQMDIQTPILRYWASQIYRALADIFQMCSYFPKLPIKLSDFQVCFQGLRIMLGGCKFLHKRDQQDQLNIKNNVSEVNLNSKINKRLGQNNRPIDPLQAKLLRNLGLLLLQLLKITEEQIHTKIQKIEERSLINALLHAFEGHQSYSKGVIGCYISIFNVQTHPIFQITQQMNGQNVLQSYAAILKYSKKK